MCTPGDAIFENDNPNIFSNYFTYLYILTIEKEYITGQVASHVKKTCHFLHYCYCRASSLRRGWCVLQEACAHEGSKPVQVTYLKDGKIFSTGFSRMSERQFGLWDSVSGQRQSATRTHNRASQCSLLHAHAECAACCIGVAERSSHWIYKPKQNISIDNWLILI